MAAKRIALELDACETPRLSQWAGGSFSKVVRRAVLVDAPPPGAPLREYVPEGGCSVNERYLDAVEAAEFERVPG